MVDIYDDLEHFDFSEELQRLREENETLLDQICTLEKDNKHLTDKYTLLEKEAKELRTNISSLLKTSTLELQRKDRIIQDQREEIESLTFRRDRFVIQNSNREKYPSDKPLANVSDTISSSNRPDSQDRNASKQTLRSRNSIEQRSREPEKVLVKRVHNVNQHNSYEKTPDRNIDCTENEEQLSVVSNSNLPRFRETEFENTEVKESQHNFHQNVIKTEIEETQHTYIRNKIEERRIELTRLEFERDYSEAESMLKPKIFENKSFLPTSPRQCLSPINTKLFLDRGDSLKRTYNKTRSRSRSCERFRKTYKKRPGSPYRKLESKRFRRDRSNSRDRLRNYHSSKYRFDKYGSHRHERYDREDDNRYSSQRFDRSAPERNDKYIKTSVERRIEYKSVVGNRISTDKDDFIKKKFSPLHTTNVSAQTIENNSSNILVKTQNSEKKDQYQEFRISAEISVGKGESCKRSPTHNKIKSGTKPENKALTEIVVRHSKDIHKQCDDSRENTNIFVRQKSAVENSLPIPVNHQDSSGRKQENMIYITSDDIEEGEIIMNEHDNNDVQCTSINTTTYTNENISDHFEESSNYMKQTAVIKTSLKCDSPSSINSTGKSRFSVENSAESNKNTSINQTKYNMKMNKSDLFEESFKYEKKFKVVNSLKNDDPISTRPTNSLSLPIENSSQQGNIDSSRSACNTNENKFDLFEESSDNVKKHKVAHSSSKCDYSSSTKSTGNLSLPYENSDQLDQNSARQRAYNTNEKKSYPFEKSSKYVEKPKLTDSLKNDDPSSTRSTSNLNLPFENSARQDEINSSENKYNKNENKSDHFEECSDCVKKPKVINSLKCCDPSSNKATNNLSVPIEDSAQLDKINSNQRAYNTNGNKCDHFEESSNDGKKPKDINNFTKCDSSRSTKSTANISLSVENSAQLDQNNSSQTVYNKNENKSDYIKECSEYMKKPKEITSSSKYGNSSLNKSTGNLSLSVESLRHLDQNNLNCQKAYNMNENKNDLFEECSDNVKNTKINSSSICENPSSTKSTVIINLPVENSAQLDHTNSSQRAHSTNEKKSQESSKYVKKPKLTNSLKTVISIDKLSLSFENSAQLDKIDSSPAYNTNENKTNFFEECTDSAKKPEVINSSLKCDNSSSIKSINNLSLSVDNSSQMAKIDQSRRANNTNENKNDLFEECSDHAKKPKIINSSSKCDNLSSIKSAVNLSLAVEKSAQLDKISSSQRAHNTNKNKSNLFEECSDSVKKPEVITSSKCDNPSSTKSTVNFNIPVENSAELNKNNSSHQTAYNTKKNKNDLFEESSEYVKKSKVIISLKNDDPSSIKSTNNVSFPANNSYQLDKIDSSQRAYNTNENKCDLFEECADHVKKPEVINSSSKCGNLSSIKSTVNFSLEKSAQLDKIDLCRRAHNMNNKSDLFEECSDHVKKPGVLNSSSKCDNLSSIKSAVNLSLAVEKSAQLDKISSSQRAHNTNENKSNLFEECSDSVKKPDVITSSKCDNLSSIKSAVNLSLAVEKSAQLDKISSSQRAHNTNENKSNLFEECSDSVKKPDVITSSKCDNLGSTKSTVNFDIPVENSAELNKNNSSHQIAYNTKKSKNDLFEESSEYVKKSKVIKSLKNDDSSSIESTNNASFSVDNSSQLDKIDSSRRAYNTNENKCDLFEEYPDHVKKPEVINFPSKCDSPSTIKSTINFSLQVEESAQLDQINSSGRACNANEHNFEASSDCVKTSKVINSSPKCAISSKTKLPDNLSLSVGNSNRRAYNTHINKTDLFGECSVKKPEVINSSEYENSTSSAQLGQNNSNCQKIYNTNENKSVEGNSDSVMKSGNLSLSVGNSAQSNQSNSIQQLSNHQKIITKQPRKIQYCFSQPSKTISSEKAKISEKSSEQVSRNSRGNESSVTDHKKCNGPKNITKSNLKSDISAPKASVNVQGETENTFHIKVIRRGTIIKKLN